MTRANEHKKKLATKFNFTLSSAFNLNWMSVGIVAGLIGFSAPSFAKLIIVSDIDDTIKISHVLDFQSALVNAIKTDEDNAFKGMSSIYRSLKVNYPDSEFYYVSNAPESLMRGLHQDFLDNNQFPKGQLDLNPELSGDHKMAAISKIIANHPTDRFIFLGDNGENDVFTYGTLASGLKGGANRSLQYIRIDYALSEGGKSLQGPQQMGFVSAGELAFQLYSLGLLNWPQAYQVLKGALTQGWYDAFLTPAQRLGLPSWVTCSEHETPANWTEVKSPELQALLVAIDRRCH